MNSSNPCTTYNLEDLIYEGKSGEFNIKKTSLLVKIGNNVRMISNIYDKYYDFLLPAINDIKLSNSEFEKYKYDPKRLSLDLYGTIEMWFLLIKINRCSSIMNFNKRIIKVIHPQKIEILNKILNIVDDDIQKNHNKTYNEK